MGTWSFCICIQKSSNGVWHCKQRFNHVKRATLLCGLRRRTMGAAAVRASWVKVEAVNNATSPPKGVPPDTSSTANSSMARASPVVCSTKHWHLVFLYMHSRRPRHPLPTRRARQPKQRRLFCDGDAVPRTFDSWKAGRLSKQT